MNVRPAVPADAPILVTFNAALARETEDKHLDPGRLRAGVDAQLGDPARGRYLIAEEDRGEDRGEGGGVLGALAITTEWSDWRNGWFWWVQSVYVAQGARRRGVYRALYAAVLEEARRDPQVCGVRLYVEHENHAARATYESLGMTETSYRLYETDFRTTGATTGDR